MDFHKISHSHLNIVDEINQYASSDVDTYQRRLDYYLKNNMIDDFQLREYHSETGLVDIESVEFEQKLKRLNLEEKRLTEAADKIKIKIKTVNNKISKSEGKEEAVTNEISAYTIDGKKTGFNKKHYNLFRVLLFVVMLASLYIYVAVVYKAQGEFVRRNPLFDHFLNFSARGVIDAVRRDFIPLIWPCFLIGTTLFLQWIKILKIKDKKQKILISILIVSFVLIMEIAYTFNAVERINLGKKPQGEIDLAAKLIEYFKYFIYPVIPFALFNGVAVLSFNEKKKNHVVDELEYNLEQIKKQIIKLQEEEEDFKDKLSLNQDEQNKITQRRTILMSEKQKVFEKVGLKIFRKHQLFSLRELNEKWIEEAIKNEKQDETYKAASDIQKIKHEKYVRNQLMTAYNDFVNKNFDI